MDRLWSWNHPVVAREVLEDLQQHRDLAYTTVLTVLENLRRKGFAGREKDGRAYRYFATNTKDEHTAALMGEVLADSGDRSSTLLRFVEQMSADEVARLREALAVLETDGHRTE